MSNIRRWFIYILCAINLEVAGGTLIASMQHSALNYQTDFWELADYYVGTFCSVPIFLGYWLWAGWIVFRNPQERQAFPRRFYLYFIMGVSLAQVVIYTLPIPAALYNQIFGISSSPTYPAGTLTNREVLLMALTGLFWSGAVFFFHWMVKMRDERPGSDNDKTIFLGHLYRYLFSAVGLVLFAVGASRLVALLFSKLFPGLAGGSISTGVELTRLVLGLLIWFFHWHTAQRPFKGSGQGEKPAQFRKIYLNLTVLAAGMAFIIASTAFLASLLRRLNQLSGKPGDLGSTLAVLLISGLILAFQIVFLRREGKLSSKINGKAILQHLRLIKTAPLARDNNEKPALSDAYLLLTLGSALALTILWYLTVLGPYLYFVIANISDGSP